jgi:hypothetical protein
MLLIAIITFILLALFKVSLGNAVLIFIAANLFYIGLVFGSRE